MAGRGPAPKPAALRQRRNRPKAGAASLPAQVSSAATNLPMLPNPDEREFHALTLAWWGRVWESPMAGEYLPTDVDGLGRLALLVDDFHQATSPTGRAELLREIRLQEARFGLSPVDRSRLQWEVAKGEEAASKRRPQQTATASERPSADPRGVLRAVK